MGKRRILITGAAGRIGSSLRAFWRDKYELVLTDRKAVEHPDEARVIIGDITDLELMRKACEGIDTLVHLAANPSARAEFHSQLLQMNIIGTHEVLQAAAEAGVKRTVYASSVHAVGGYPPDVQVKWDMPVRPCCEYGTTKCYGEALGRYFSDRHGMSFIAIRIGGFHDHPEGDDAHNPSMLDFLISDEDLCQLVTRCVEAPDNLRYAIFHGLSNSPFKRLDISHAREVLGYEPVDEVKAQGIACPVPGPLDH